MAPREPRGLQRKVHAGCVDLHFQNPEQSPSFAISCVLEDLYEHSRNSADPQ